MTEPIAAADSSQSQQQKPVAREDIAGGFSFAAAMTALEGRAATALQTYGASPDGGAPGQNTQSATASNQDTDFKNQSRAIENEITPQERNAASETARAPQTVQLEAPQQLQQGAAPPPQQANIALIGVAPAPAAQITPAMSARVEMAAMREAALAKTSAPKAPRPVQQAQSAAPAQNFAHLLAKKLANGATTFELRLDPPHLGRVDAQLTLGDDGEAVVALRFENQNALDLFARDEAGLRTALSSSGQDFDQHQFTFDLHETDDAAAGTISETAAQSAEPTFTASFSTGAVDMRI